MEKAMLTSGESAGEFGSEAQLSQFVPALGAASEARAFFIESAANNE